MSIVILMIASVLVVLIVMTNDDASRCLTIIQEKKAAAAKRRGAAGAGAAPGLQSGQAEAGGGVFESCDSDIACSIKIGGRRSICLCLCAQCVINARVCICLFTVCFNDVAQEL